MSEIQDKIAEWSGKTFPDGTAITRFTHLKQEIKKLGEALYEDSSNLDIADEIADCMILLIGIAEDCDIDALNALS